MGLKVKSNTNYDLGDNLTDFFSLPVDTLTETNKISDDLKERIYALNADSEEKANIINMISKYNSTSNQKEKNKLKKEIDSFIEENE